MFTMFTHHNAMIIKTCPHPFQLEMNWVASFSVKKEREKKYTQTRPSFLDKSPRTVYWFFYTTLKLIELFCFEFVSLASRDKLYKLKGKHAGTVL